MPDETPKDPNEEFLDEDESPDLSLHDFVEEEPLDESDMYDDETIHAEDTEGGFDDQRLMTVEGEVVDEEDRAYDPDRTHHLRRDDDISQTRRIQLPADDEEELETSEPETDISDDLLRVNELLSIPIRQKHSNRLAIFPFAMGFITLGGLLLAEKRIEGLEVTLPAAIVIIVGALVLTYIFRFFTSGRRERGLFFLATVTMVWGSVIALTVLNSDDFEIAEFWPLILAGIGVAFFFTFLFERTHQVGLVFPGIILMFASAVAFAITLGIIDQTVLDAVADYWPLVLAFVGLTLLPSALQDQ
jgi:hypothetical protein